MSKSMKSFVAGAVVACLPLWSLAQAVPREPEGIVSLESSATVQVPNDWMAVDFSTTKEGTDAAAVQAALKAALAAAIAQARQVAKGDGRVEVEGGGFALEPRVNTKGVINGWTGTTSLTVQGRDMPAIADLAGRITTLTVGNLGYSVSREAREKVEGEVTAQAIARFRAKAADYAKAFGYAGFAVREVNVNADGASPPRPYAMKARDASLMSAPPLPVAAGSGSVTARVSGTVQMK